MLFNSLSTTLLLAGSGLPNTPFVSAAIVPRATTSSPATAILQVSCPASNGTTYTAQSGKIFLIECYNNHKAGDLSLSYVSSLAACIEACDAAKTCVAFSWGSTSNGGSHPCYLKSSIGANQQNSGVWGGKVAAVSSSSAQVSPSKSSSSATQPSKSSSSSLVKSSSSSSRFSSSAPITSSKSSTSSSSTGQSSKPSSSSLATPSSSKIGSSMQSSSTTSGRSTVSPSASSSSSTISATSTNCGAPEATPYWVDSLKHQGISPFNSNSSYQVYRNVKCYGAKGDGATDDTAAINAAIASSNRCGSGCKSSTTTPAFVYFPGGNYLITSPIQALYYTQLVGNPTDIPHIIGRGDFQGIALIDGNPFYESTNNFYRSIRNFVIDTTQIPANQYGTGIHWQVAQATSLQNIRFELSTVPGNLHQGLYGEDGSGGFMSDLTFNNGKYGMFMGNQQFTSRNMVFNGQSNAAVFLTFDWGWTFSNLQVSNVPIGIDISNGGGNNQAISSAILLDSTFTNVNTAVNTARNSSTNSPPAAGSLIIENLAINNVPVVVAGLGSVSYAGTTGSATVNYGQGREYIPGAQGQYFQSAITPKARPASLLAGGKYIGKSQPLYSSNTASDFVSVRTLGAKGDGVTDDTNALNTAFASGKIVFVDHGVYLVRGTLIVPPGARIVGECWPRIMADGSSSAFSNMNLPQALLQVGTAGQSGLVEISGLVVQVKGPAPGVKMIEWNLASSNSNPAGLWDVHATVGGTAGTNLQAAQCSTSAAQPNTNCIGAFMLVHVTKSASATYFENTWFWTADHQVDNDNSETQITVFTGRGLLIESVSGPTWLYGTAVEHNVMYQYQLSNTANVFAGLIQTETPYYQSNPQAPAPFDTNTAYNDPNFAALCANAVNAAICNKALGLRITGSDQALIYGAGLYSFFENYSTSCLNNNCQTNMVEVDNEGSGYVLIYGLSTVGVVNQITVNGVPAALGTDNVGTFPDTIAYYRNS